MNKYKRLEEKIKSMTGKEIVLAMVDSLRHPVTEIYMGTFGYKHEGVCYGCAATNTICKLGGFDPNEELIEDGDGYTNYSLITPLDMFELAIDELRSGHIEQYNHCAERGGFATLKRKGDLPYLTNNLSENELKKYEEFAEKQ